MPVSGFVLAGGHSSRMGRDKALLELAGKPLVAHAVAKLRRLCAEVAILSNNEALTAFAPVVRDLHPDCGPMSGLEAALAHTAHDWSVILPVDVPLVPTSLLWDWMRTTLDADKRYGTRLSVQVVGAVPQPTFCMVHRELGPSLTEALAAGRYKLYPELVAAAQAVAGAGDGCMPVLRYVWSEGATFRPMGGVGLPGWAGTTSAQAAAGQMYFMNLNTPEDFVQAEEHVDVLDT